MINEYNSYTLLLLTTDVDHSQGCGVCAMNLNIAHSKSMHRLYIRNYKNIAKSIAYHHQRTMCYEMADSETYLALKEVYGQGI